MTTVSRESLEISNNVPLLSDPGLLIHETSRLQDAVSDLDNTRDQTLPNQPPAQLDADDEESQSPRDRMVEINLFDRDGEESSPDVVKFFTNLKVKSSVKGSGIKKTWSQRTFSNIGPGSLRGSYFTLLSTALGAVVLTMPYMMSSCGFVLGTLFIIANGSLNLWSLHVLAEISFKTHTMQYSEAVEKTMGKTVGLIFSWVIIVYCFGTLISYFITLNQFFISFLGAVEIISQDTATLWMTPGSSEYYHTYIILILIGILCFPVAAMRNLSSFRHFALFGCIVVMYIFVVIIAQAPVQNAKLQPEADFFIFSWDTVVAWVVATYSYTMQGNFFPIRVELQRPSFVRMIKISDRLLGTLMSIYVIISIFGYLSLGDMTPQIFINRTQGVGWLDLAMTIAKGLMSINIFFAIPLNLSPCRLEVLILLKKDKDTSNLAHYLSTALLIGGCVLVAVFIPHVVTALGILGGICSTSLCATFPAFMYLKVKTWDSSNKYKKIFVQFIAYGVSALGLIGATVIVFQEFGFLAQRPQI